MKTSRVVAFGVVMVGAAVSATLVGAGGPVSAAGAPSSAFGLAASGVVPIDETPSVVSEDGAPVSDALAEVPDNPLLSASAFAVHAENGRASSGVVDLAVGRGLMSRLPEDLAGQLEPVCAQLGQVDFGEVTDGLGKLVVDPLQDALNDGTDDSPIDLGAITALDFSALVPSNLQGLCDVLDGTALVGADAVRASCDGDRGAIEVVGLRVLGLPMDVDTRSANASVGIPGVVEVTVNRQARRADGRFTVDALVLDLFGQQEVVVASATCGEVTAGRPPGRAPAPSPVPVPGDLPVTG